MIKQKIIIKDKAFLVIIILAFVCNSNNIFAQKQGGGFMDSLFNLSIEQLLKVEVVSASKRSNILPLAPATIKIITSKQIENYGYQNLDDALNDLPGINLINVHGAFPTIRTFRGAYGDENKRILLMIDGNVENQIIGSFELGGKMISLHNVERIEIIWGPASALYGANAYSGIINLITKKKPKYKNIKYEKNFGTFNTQIDNFTFNLNKDSINISVSGTLVNSDGPQFKNRDIRFSDAYINNAYSLFGRFSIKHKLGNTSIHVNLIKNSSGDGTFGNTASSIFNLPPSGYMNNNNQGFIARNFNNEKPSRWAPYTTSYYLINNFKFSSKIQLNKKLFFRESGVDESSYSYIMISDTSVRRNNITHQSFRYGAELELEYKISPIQSLVSGVSFYHDNLEHGYRAWDMDTNYILVDSIWVLNANGRFQNRQYNTRDNFGAFTQYVLNTNFLKQTTFTLGARYDFNSIYGQTFNPRVGMVVKPSERFAFKLLYGTAFREPTNFEINSELAPIRIANNDLKPEKVSTYELGLNFMFANIFVEISSFYNLLSDIIVADVPVGNGIGQIQNAGSATIYGGEISSTFSLNKFVTGFANLSYLKTRQVVIGVESIIPNIPDFSFNIGSTVNLFNSINVSISGKYIGITELIASNPLERLDSYFTTNLTLSTHQLYNNKVKLTFQLNNLFNTTYFHPGIRAANGGFYSTVHDQPGRNGYIKISFAF